MNKGGRREGAGRKPCTDKKQQFSIYLRPSVIECLGKKKIKEICESEINRFYQKELGYEIQR